MSQSVKNPSGDAAEIPIVPPIPAPAADEPIPPLVYKGREWVPQKLTAAEAIIAIEERIRENRVDAIAAIKPQLKELDGMPQLQEALLRMAYEDIRDKRKDGLVTQAEIFSFMQSRVGLTYVLFLGLQKAYPAEMTEKLANEIAMHHHVDSLVKRAADLNRDGLIAAAKAKEALAAAAK